MPDGEEGVFEARAQGVTLGDIPLGQLEAEVVDMEGHPAHSLDVIGVLVLDNDAEGPEHGQHPGQGDGIPGPDDLQASQA